MATIQKMEFLSKRSCWLIFAFLISDLKCGQSATKRPHWKGFGVDRTAFSPRCGTRFPHLSDFSRSRPKPQSRPKPYFKSRFLISAFQSWSMVKLEISFQSWEGFPKVACLPLCDLFGDGTLSRLTNKAILVRSVFRTVFKLGRLLFADFDLLWTWSG